MRDGLSASLHVLISGVSQPATAKVSKCDDQLKQRAVLSLRLDDKRHMRLITAMSIPQCVRVSVV